MAKVGGYRLLLVAYLLVFRLHLLLSLRFPEIHKPGFHLGKLLMVVAPLRTMNIH